MNAQQANVGRKTSKIMFGVFAIAAIMLWPIRVPGAIEIDGTTERFYASSAVATEPPLAMSCWFWADQAQLATLIAQNGASNNYFELKTRASPLTIQAQARDVGGFGTATSTTTYQSGQWHHVFAVFYSNTSRKVWLDGAGEGENITDRSPSGVSETGIGARGVSSPVQFFKGRVAEPAIWAGSGVEDMGDAEAKPLASGVRPTNLFAFKDKLVFWQSFHEVANESDAIGPSLTTTGTPTAAAHPPTLIIVPRQMRTYGGHR